MLTGVGALAAAQFAVVSSTQLRAAGLGRGAIEKAVLSGRLLRLHTGVFAVGHASLKVEGRRLAAGLGALCSRAARAPGDPPARSRHRAETPAAH